jgi:2-phosphosulfolactate phosphatase
MVESKPNRVYTYFTHQEFDPQRRSFSQFFVIDVLRATTTISTILEQGATTIYPCTTIAEALSLYGEKEDVQPLLVGERGGIKPEGFDYGNSPHEFAALNLQSREVIITTSNGTVAMRKCAAQGDVFLLSFHNLPVCAEIFANGKDTAIVCSGSHGEFCYEDALCAGLFLRLAGVDETTELNDQSGVALDLSAGVELADIGPLMHRRARHANYLSHLGFAQDVDFAAEYDRSRIVPQFSGERINGT